MKLNKILLSTLVAGLTWNVAPIAMATDICQTDDQCREFSTCDGTFTCSPTNPNANAMGCVNTHRAPRCGSGLTCVPFNTRNPLGRLGDHRNPIRFEYVNTYKCVSLTSCENGHDDEDRDGYKNPRCGGTDCDDYDPHRFPGNPERCDNSGHDDDCNPITVAQGQTFTSGTGSPVGQSLDGDADNDNYKSEFCAYPVGTVLPKK